MIYNLNPIQAHHGPLLFARPNSTDADVIREIWEENVYRVTLSDCWGTVVDAGANIGVFALFAALHGAERVVAVEPEPDNAIILAANIAASPQVSHRSVALWNEKGHVSMAPSQGGTQVNADGPLTIPSLALADLFAEESISECSILKMDIEGSEYMVLSATPSDLLARVHYLTMEFHATDAATFGALVAKLSLTHAVQTLGSYERGGYLYCRKF